MKKQLTETPEDYYNKLRQILTEGKVMFRYCSNDKKFQNSRRHSKTLQLLQTTENHRTLEKNNKLQRMLDRKF